MRPRGASILPPGAVYEAAPAPGPARDALGLPYNPPPNVIHHPSQRHVEGSHRAESGVTAKVDGDGAVSFKDPGAVEDLRPSAAVGLGVAGKFDLNDQVARAMGDDPYAYAKRKYREATFEDRLCLAEKAAVRRKQEGLFHLKARLEQLLRAPALSSAQRREMLFEMWDECLDDTSDGPNLGAGARATIVAFIRRVFPPTGEQAYAVNELAAFNRRRSSRALFDPYGSFTTGRPGAARPAAP